jgi:hypothetical protein
MADEFLNATYAAAMRTYDAELAEANAEYIRAQSDMDPIAAADAGRRYSATLVQRDMFHHVAVGQANAAAAAPRQNPRGLSDDQMEAARVCGVTPDEYADGYIACDHQGRFTWQNGMGRR